MKKLVLAMVFVVLMALFIAFNYLLLDRENKVKELKDLEFENANNSASMSMQNREIKSLEEENSSQQLKISQLESDVDQLNKKNSDLSAEKEQLNRKIKDKTDLLNALKEISDMKVLEQPVKKWLEAINAGDYDTAYELEYASLASYGNPPGAFAYSESLKATVKSISLKSIKTDTSRGAGDGDIILDAELEVKLVDKAVSQVYKEGLNEKFIKIGYDVNKKEFVILQIF